MVVGSNKECMECNFFTCLESTLQYTLAKKPTKNTLAQSWIFAKQSKITIISIYNGF